MDRFQEETAADLAANYRQERERQEESRAEMREELANDRREA